MSTSLVRSTELTLGECGFIMKDRRFAGSSAARPRLTGTIYMVAWQWASAAAEGMAALSLFISGLRAPAQSQSLAKPESTDSINSHFAKPWHAQQPRPIVMAAWERLKQLDIPGIDLDQHFRPKGSALYVGPNGDDTAEGSREHPWRTLRHAAAQLRPGTVIYLMPGIYYGPVEIRTKATEQ